MNTSTPTPRLRPLAIDERVRTASLPWPWLSEAEAAGMVSKIDAVTRRARRIMSTSTSLDPLGVTPDPAPTGFYRGLGADGEARAQWHYETFAPHLRGRALREFCRMTVRTIPAIRPAADLALARERWSSRIVVRARGGHPVMMTVGAGKTLRLDWLR